jgi:hypothetical protein
MFAEIENGEASTWGMALDVIVSAATDRSLAAWRCRRG